MKKKYIVKEKLFLDSANIQGENTLAAMVDTLISKTNYKTKTINKRKVVTCLVEVVQNIYNYSETKFQDYASVEVSASDTGIMTIEAENLLSIANMQNLEAILGKVKRKTPKEIDDMYDEKLFDEQEPADTKNGLGLLYIIKNADSFMYGFEQITGKMFKFNFTLIFR